MKPFQYQSSQRGIYLIEFALVAGLFLLTVLTVVDMARVFYMLNAASEMTRHGARVAAVCDVNDPDIKNAMIAKGSFVEPSNISITYQPAGCGQATCQTISVGLNGVVISTLVGIDINVPNYLTTLPRESMNSASNSICS